MASACGSRSGLNVDESSGDAGPDTACAGPVCADNTRGTWRLETAQGQAGYLFTFDGSAACNGAPTAFLLVLTANGQKCSRNGDYVIQANTASSLRFFADSMGGSFSEACGGHPGGESIQIELERATCDAARYDLRVRDSRPDSPYTLSAVATRCRCDIGWEPCVQPLPDDPCTP
ncbi:MAG: hypothetical protein R3B13_08045 [Polyangiaceae bacterium]